MAQRSRRTVGSAGGYRSSAVGGAVVPAGRIVRPLQPPHRRRGRRCNRLRRCNRRSWLVLCARLHTLYRAWSCCARVVLLLCPVRLPSNVLFFLMVPSPRTAGACPSCRRGSEFVATCQQAMQRAMHQRRGCIMRMHCALQCNLLGIQSDRVRILSRLRERPPRIQNLKNIFLIILYLSKFQPIFHEVSP